MPITRSARSVATACLVLVTLFGAAPRPAAALEPPRPLPGYRPAFVTETDSRPIIDCMWASAAMMLDKWTNGDVRVGHERLRRLSGDLHGGSSFEDLRVAFRRLGFRVSLNRNGDSTLTWGGLLSRLRKGAGAVVLGDYSHLPRWYGRWDYSFWKKKGKKDNHAVYVERYDRKRGRVWMMDPLAHGGWRGEWISIWALQRFAWGSGGRVAAVVTPTARPRPFAGVSVGKSEMRVSTDAVTAMWALGAPKRWSYPGTDVHTRFTAAASPLQAAAANAEASLPASVDAAPARPTARMDGRTLRATAALPARPGAYLASLSLTERRFGSTVARSAPVAVFVPGPRRATLRLNVRDAYVAAGDRVKVSVSVANTGEITWAEPLRPGEREPILGTRVTATWIRLDAPAGEAGDEGDGDVAAPETVDVEGAPLARGQLVRVHADLVAPGRAGRWALVIDVTDNLDGSFAARGSAPAVAVFTVLTPSEMATVE